MAGPQKSSKTQKSAKNRQKSRNLPKIVQNPRFWPKPQILDQNPRFGTQTSDFGPQNHPQTPDFGPQIWDPDPRFWTPNPAKTPESGTQNPEVRPAGSDLWLIGHNLPDICWLVLAVGSLRSAARGVVPTQLIDRQSLLMSEPGSARCYVMFHSNERQRVV